jgi:hypothetical protein
LHSSSDYAIELIRREMSRCAPLQTIHWMPQEWATFSMQMTADGEVGCIFTAPKKRQIELRSSA